jgi:RNA 2',3'-cyclic 3'-phosphodiesterase
MPRLFTAIEVPSEIADDLHHVHLPLPGARWIKPESYHITLRFIGDVSNSDAREFAANISRIEPDGFELRLAGVGVFGGDDPHAVWAAVEPNVKLEELAKLHEKAARAARLPPETRPFKPHVTLARLKHSSAEAVARFLTRYGSYRSEPFFVARTVLMSSKPMSGGGPYGIEDRFPMRGMEFLSEDGEASW